MNRLVVNPGTPQAWEIQLKPGANLLGRGFANDFKIEDLSVSSSHCQIVVRDDSVIVTDLGSTNGTFVDRTPIQEARLQSGQSLRLGAVEMVYYSGNGEAAAEQAAPPPPPSRPAVRISAPPPLPPPVQAPATGGPRFCKFHPKSPARYLCLKCNRTFCELCVNSRNVGGSPRKICRSCGVECIPLQTGATQVTRRKGFFASLPGAFVYPFRGSGVMVLVAAAIIFAALDIVGRTLMRGLFMFLIGLFIEMLAVGYLFSFMQAIIHSTASDDDEMPELPPLEGLLSACFRMVGTVLVSFGPAIAVLILAFKSGNPAAGIALIPAVIFACVYFPMALLAVAMKDTVMAANPLVVVPSIFKVPLEYLVAVFLLGSIFGFEKLAGIILDFFFPHTLVTLTTHSVSQLLLIFGLRVGWSLGSFYLLTVNMRILGLLYRTRKQKLGWFSH